MMNYNVEFLRLAAAFGIVVFHAGDIPGRLPAYAGVIVFVILFIFFIPNPGKYGTGRSLANRFQRLIIPWMAWTLVYGIINVLLGRSFYNYPEVTVWVLLSGTSVHLWFLPFAFFVSAAVICFESITPRRAYLQAVCGILCVASLPAVSYWGNVAGELPLPFHQWRHALPAVFIGLTFRYCASRKYAALFSAAAVISCLYASGMGSDSYGTPYVIGILASVVCLYAPNFIPKWITRYSKDAYGIYLAHPVFYILAWTNAIPSSFPLALAVFFLSFLLAHYLRKLPSSRFYC